MRQIVPRHRVFVSFHHDDENRKDQFVRMMGGNIIDESVGDGDIDDDLPTETMRRIIRDKFIRDASVTVVLIGKCTWQRKHVDWEIGSSLRDAPLNRRCGLLGILLPSHPDYGKTDFNPRLMPPRLAANCDGNDPYSRIYHWSTQADKIREWIHAAFQRKDKNPPPHNNTQQFRNNRRGDCSRDWQN